MQNTPKSLRLQIGLFGRTNVGKSSLLNLLSGREAAIASPVPGTTTDPVEIAMEFHRLGPVVFIDTGGMDDESELGAARRKRTLAALARTDAAVLVLEPGVWGTTEEELAAAAKLAKKPLLAVVTKTDLAQPDEEFLGRVRGTSDALVVSSGDASRADGVRQAFEEALLSLRAREAMPSPAPGLLEGILPENGTMVLITPIDKEAPKGRLILPQVQVMRAGLDRHAAVLAVQPEEYAEALGRLRAAPDLVVCDSQVVDRMVAETPAEVPCTTFSILFARMKGDLPSMARAARCIGRLANGDRVLIAEACAHHPIEDDIGRVKIPRWLRERTGKDLAIDVVAGRDWPENLGDYRLAIHCGGCMMTRTEVLARMASAGTEGVPVTNYGVAISELKGVLERVLSPFPGALAAWREG